MGTGSVEKPPIFDLIELGKKWEMPRKERCDQGSNGQNQLIMNSFGNSIFRVNLYLFGSKKSY